MRVVGWLEGEDGALRFPNIERHNGREAKRKAQNARRNQNLRSRSESSHSDASDEYRDAVRVTEASPEKSREEKRERKESASAVSATDFDEFVKTWNESGLTQCRKLTDKRRKALRSRLTDEDWKANWREALAKAAKSSFCRGNSDRGWRADIDWFLQPDSVVKLLVVRGSLIAGCRYMVIDGLMCRD